MKEFIQKQITKKAHKLIKEHKPIIIAVTGSVGKTSTRNAIAAVLSKKYFVAKNIDNYNNEFGVPLTILGHRSPGKSIIGWLKILLSTQKNVPQVYVLEYGIDHPGDMKILCDIARPNIGVMTGISPVHVENFQTVEQLAEEKAQLLDCVYEDGLVVINGDDAKVRGLIKHAKAKVIKYGFSESSDATVLDFNVYTREDFSFEPGENFSKINITAKTQDGDVLRFDLVNMLGKAVARSATAAVSIAKHLGLSNEEIVAGVSDIVQEPGRMNALAGIKGSLIIDSSYNAAPASMAEALDVLSEFTLQDEQRRIVVFGEMAELGRYTEDEHRMIGMKIAEVGADILVTVGEKTRDMQRGAIDAGLDESKTEHFNNSADAGRWLDSKVRKGDIVLVKGSQSSRMEKVTKDLIAQPLRSGELLVRQSDKWLD